MGEPLIRVGSGAPNPGIEPGTYHARIVGVKPVTISSEYGENRPMLRWEFEIPTSDPNQVIPVDGLSSQMASLSARSKTGRWLSALLGPIRTDQTIEEAELIGKTCQIVCEINANGFLTVRDVIAPPRQIPPAAAAGPAPQPVAPQNGAATTPPPPPPARPTVRQQAGLPSDADDLPF